MRRVSGRGVFVAPLLALAMLAFAHCAVPTAQAEDVVVLATDGGGTMTVRGTVLDYRGDGLKIEDHTGVARTFPAARVIDIRTPLSPQAEEAERRFAAHQWAEAVPLYQAARNAETRGWVRLRLTARLVRCLDNLGQAEPAGREFVDVLLAADPNTPYFDVCPLPWLPASPDPSLQQAALGWMRSPHPAARLLGAAHLAAGPHAVEARSTLQALTTTAPKPIAQAALVQLDRRDILAASEDILRSRERLLRDMPRNVRGGGYYLLGTAWAQRQRWEDATACFMRVVILHDDQYRLAARALAEAVRCREKLSDRESAERLRYELTQRFADTPEGEAARAAP